MYKCSICDTEAIVDHVNPPVRPCGHTEGTILAEMSGNLTATNFGKYNQLLDFGTDFGNASVLLKKHDESSHLYLYLACHSIENLFKYLLCKEKGYEFEYEKITNKGGVYYKSKTGHDILKLGQELKKTQYVELITADLEKEIIGLKGLFTKASLAYGNIETQFTVASDFKSDEIFKCISEIISSSREGSK